MALLKKKDKRIALRQDLYEHFYKDGVSLPDAIKTLRKILLWDQSRMAKEAGVSLSALRRIEQGYSNVRLDTIERILKIFDLSMVVVKRS